MAGNVQAPLLTKIVATMGPAIAAGCTMVAKPAQLTPLSMLKLAEILGECGLPDGVLWPLPKST